MNAMTNHATGLEAQVREHQRKELERSKCGNLLQQTKDMLAESVNLIHTRDTRLGETEEVLRVIQDLLLIALVSLLKNFC